MKHVDAPLTEVLEALPIDRLISSLIASTQQLNEYQSANILRVSLVTVEAQSQMTISSVSNRMS